MPHQNDHKILRRSDAESIHVKAGDDILIGANKDILQVGVVRLHLLEGKKITDGLIGWGAWSRSANSSPM
jgi:hypothetical protein